MGKFKERYPQVHSMGDAGELLMGPIGREIFFVGQLLFIIFLMASHILTFSVLFNTITNHGTCTIVFGVVGLLVSCIAALPRTAEKVFWMSIVSAISILVATIVTMVSIAVQAPDNVQNDIVTTPTFQEGFLAVTNIVFAFIAHVSFFGIMSEMQDPADFPKALAMLQVVDTTMYVVTAMVIYCYAGPGVSSPALSSAGPMMKKVAYGLAIPTVRYLSLQFIYESILISDRSLLPVSFSATLHASISMFESSAATAPTTCIRRVSWLRVHGLRSVYLRGLLLGSSQSRFLCSTSC
jgi:uncharacterized membrane protein